MSTADDAILALTPDDTVDTVLAQVRAKHSPIVQVLVPPATGALQAPRGFERLRRALDAEGITLLVFSADEQVIAAARRNNIDSFLIDDGRAKRPPLPPRERSTRPIPQPQIDPRDAEFIDALGQVPARDRYADDPDADLYAALDDFSDAAQEYERTERRPTSDDEFAAALDDWSVGDAEPPRERTTRRYTAADIDLDEDPRARPTASRRRATGARDAYDDAARYPVRRSPLPLILIALLLLLLAAGAAWMLSNRTTVQVALPVSAAGDHPFKGEIIPLDAAGNGSGAAVQAAPVTADAEASVTGTVQNETLSPSGTAKGEVTIVNTIESAVPLPKGSEFIGTNAKGEEVRFTLDNDSTVPPAQTTASLAGRSTTYGQINVAITARSPGSASNVGENTIKKILIPGQQPIVSDTSNFLIRNAAIGGGSEAPQRIVTQADVEAALGQVLTALYDTGVQQLRAAIDESKFGIDATTITPSTAALSNNEGYEPLVVEPAVGQPVADPNNPTFRITARASFKALATPRGKSVADQLGTVVRDYFAQRSDSPCKAGETPSQEVQQIHWDGERLTIDGVQRCNAAGGLSAETLAKVKDALRGQSREAAEAGLRSLQQQGLIGDFQLPNRANFPGFGFLINVDVGQPAAPQPTPGATQ